MRFVSVLRTGKLRLFAYLFAEYDTLFEQKNMEVFERHPVGVATRSLGAGKHAVQQQIALGGYVALKRDGN